MSTRLISHTHRPSTQSYVNHIPVCRRLFPSGDAAVQTRGEKVVTGTTVKVNVTLRHRSGLLQTVGSRYFFFLKEQGKNMEQCQLTGSLCWSAEERHHTKDVRSECVWKHRSNSRHTVLWKVLWAWWGENGSPYSISDQLGLHNMTAETLTLCNSKTVQVERGQREVWKQAENKNKSEQDWCRKDRFRRMNIHDPYPPSAMLRKPWLCKMGCKDGK